MLHINIVYILNIFRLPREVPSTFCIILVAQYKSLALTFGDNVFDLYVSTEMSVNDGSNSR